jgi:hypothetical protein
MATSEAAESIICAVLAREGIPTTPLDGGAATAAL